MQISDLVGHYMNAAGSQAEPITKKKGIERFASSMSEMEKGNVFEGTVNAVKGKTVILGLSNGQQITARLDAKMTLQPGQSMFFQVKSNEGNMVAIRPFTVDGAGANLTLLEALKEAGLPTSEEHLVMVNKMMEEQMPIDRNSLNMMARLMQNTPEIDVKTLVQLKKLDLPMNIEFATQFENYLGDKQEISMALDQFMEALPETLSNEQLSSAVLTQMEYDILTIVTENLSEEIEIPKQLAGDQVELVADERLDEQVTGVSPDKNVVSSKEMALEQASSVKLEEGVVNVKDASVNIEDASVNMKDGSVNMKDGSVNMKDGSVNIRDASVNMKDGSIKSEDASVNVKEGAVKLGDASMKGKEPSVRMEETFLKLKDAFWKSGEVKSDEKHMQASLIKGEKWQQELMNDKPLVAPNSLGSILNEEQQEYLKGQLQVLFTEANQEYDVSKLNKNTSVVSVLRDIQELLAGNPKMDKNVLMEFFSGNECKALIKDALEQQWTVRPKDLAGPDKINRLYEKIEQQLSRIEDIVKATGQQENQVLNLSENIRANVDFMKQINEMYTYVQIPLKMSGQNASGQIYVYTNKKKLEQGDKDLTAFLHLDMDHLGQTDVAVRMHGTEVTTNFYMEDDTSYALLKQFMPQLEARLAAKGYKCTLIVNNESKKVNFVEDFLKKDRPSAGQVRRYSFDMRA